MAQGPAAPSLPSVRDLCAGIDALETSLSRYSVYLAQIRKQLSELRAQVDLHRRQPAYLIACMAQDMAAESFAVSPSALTLVLDLLREAVLEPASFPPEPAEGPPLPLLESDGFVVVDTAQRSAPSTPTYSSRKTRSSRRRPALFVNLHSAHPPSPGVPATPPSLPSPPPSVDTDDVAEAYVRLHNQQNRLQHLRDRTARDRLILLLQLEAATGTTPPITASPKRSPFRMHRRNNSLMKSYFPAPNEAVAAAEIVRSLPIPRRRRSEGGSFSGSDSDAASWHSAATGSIGAATRDDAASVGSGSRASLGLEPGAHMMLSELRRAAHVRGEVTAESWASYVSDTGTVPHLSQLLEHVFYGGVSQEVRPDVWKYLLGLDSVDMTKEERAERQYARRKHYSDLRNTWEAVLNGQHDDDVTLLSRLRVCRKSIEKDVVRTDAESQYFGGAGNPNTARLTAILLSYAVFKDGSVYVQGMSDLVAPLLAVMEDESEAFWCFVHLMNRMAARFEPDHAFINAACTKVMATLAALDPPLHALFVEHSVAERFVWFRWILLDFKRDFNFTEVMRLWEAMWTAYITEEFHVYVAVAMLESARTRFLSEGRDFEDILRIWNGIACSVPVESILFDAEDIYWRVARI